MAYARDSDLWSLGAAATLVHVATGHRTFEAKSDTLWCFAVAGDMDAAAPSVLDCLDRDARSRPLQPHRPARLLSTQFCMAGPRAHSSLLLTRWRRWPARASTTTWHWPVIKGTALEVRAAAGRRGTAPPTTRRCTGPSTRASSARAKRCFFAPSLYPANI